jgi:hypothetical protein
VVRGVGGRVRRGVENKLFVYPRRGTVLLLFSGARGSREGQYWTQCTWTVGSGRWGSLALSLSFVAVFSLFEARGAVLLWLSSPKLLKPGYLYKLGSNLERRPLPLNVSPSPSPSVPPLASHATPPLVDVRAGVRAHADGPGPLNSTQLPPTQYARGVRTREIRRQLSLLAATTFVNVNVNRQTVKPSAAIMPANQLSLATKAQWRVVESVVGVTVGGCESALTARVRCATRLECACERLREGGWTGRMDRRADGQTGRRGS